MKYTVRCVFTVLCMINDVYIYQDVPHILSLSTATYCTKSLHPPGCQNVSHHAFGHDKRDIPIYTVRACTCLDTYVHTLPVESPCSWISVFRILTSNNCCVFKPFVTGSSASGWDHLDGRSFSAQSSSVFH